MRSSFYTSPIRELQKERAFRSSLYKSPLRELEKERALSAARIRNDVRIRNLEDRYWNPVRGWVYPNLSPMRERYVSPLRESLALERVEREVEREKLRDSLTRSRLRESLLAERESVKKYSALKSTAAKTTRSYLDSTRGLELSPVNQSKMIVNFKDSIFDNKCLEDKRVSLALRYDFCLTELFAMIDYGKTGLLSLADWQRFSYENSLALNAEDLCVIIDRYDKGRDGLLSYSEFCDLFLPSSSNEYRATMQERVERNVYAFFEYTSLTQSHVRDLLRGAVTVEENFECNKFRLSDGRVLTSDEIFAFLDKWKTGYITLTEFQQALCEAGVYCTDSDAKTLFEQFDKNKDGRITFDEFHSPSRLNY